MNSFMYPRVLTPTSEDSGIKTLRAQQRGEGHDLRGVCWAFEGDVEAAAHDPDTGEIAELEMEELRSANISAKSSAASSQPAEEKPSRRPRWLCFSMN
jgi:hypothetical protein